MEKNIRVDYIARVEGQGELTIKVVDGTPETVQFGIFEPPKFFEAFLVGRDFREIHELTSRICGICPVPHQIAALRAVEKAVGIEVDEYTRQLRRLMNFGSHLQSHVLNLYLLAAPDYLGYESAISLARDNPELLKKGLKLKKLGNDIIEVVGGRAVHPVSAVVGGFTHTPSRAKLEDLKDRLREARRDSEETVRLFSELDLPDFERNEEQIALTRGGEYPINEGTLKSTGGLEAGEDEYRRYIKEVQVDYSWAKHSIVEGRGSFMVGPLPRVNLNYRVLSDGAREAAEAAGFKPVVHRPFEALLARAIEVLNAVEQSILIIEDLPKGKAVREDAFKPRSGFGCAVVEAPRGLLYHAYKVNDKGLVEEADIVTPTAMNARNIEEDLKGYLPTIADLREEEMILRCEMLVRAYDPCISCSVHVHRA
ncbi:MAG: Ni/Fe hydrogenase subunit alpha [Candidatus Bathyarchaeia archaeon]|nr:Ni/Fe hydrogenase subunit alpha [Candidatus Bathyarchaeota archaeon]